MENPSRTPPPLPPAAALLAAVGVEFVVHRHVEIRTEADIRERTGFTPENIKNSLRTMAFTAGHETLALAAIPGLERLRYGRLAAALGVSRSALKPADEAGLARLGMECGGVSPVCGDPSVTVVFDAAVLRMGRVLFGSGRPDSTVEADAAELIRIVPGAIVTDITST
ncbi:aminoacyl-tRNA deacylase [Actinomadura harenae]|uniref:YbaK/aminoacyl-tRNA synthetase-associated domain-containing protein n=1 Tax=Actinomadura harenae TaxID=2483351 RepID=A0A3M2M3F2_9ACTN|nr:YbaK/EbsC family protein [Actinomadura harenae]RMI43942.1 hypothetical protein EBO15_14685 [Actinomadura harenae]